jgi:histidinol-phosphate/aromatic aminotransferase/cobyric acid decarboxylase-like protein
MPIDEHSHGGNLRDLAAESGLPAEGILDFSANLNPLGPPPWLPAAVAEGLAAVSAYPDPDCSAAREAAARRFGLPAGRFLFADGADSLILALPRAVGAKRVLAFHPGYSGYQRAACRSGATFVPLPLALDPASATSPDPGILVKALEDRSGGPCLVFIGAPNNPVGGFLDEAELLRMAASRPDAVFAVDESFSELAGRPEGLVGRHPDNVIVIRSLTKTYAMPGIRVGFAEGEAGLLARLRRELPAWPLSSFAGAAATKALCDTKWPAEGAAFVAEARAGLVRDLGAFPGLRTMPGHANFLLVGLPTGTSARDVRRALLARGIAIRTYGAEEGLDDGWFRIAVRRPEENRRLVAGLAQVLGARGKA